MGSGVGGRSLDMRLNKGDLQAMFTPKIRTSVIEDFVYTEQAYLVKVLCQHKENTVENTFLYSAVLAGCIVVILKPLHICHKKHLFKGCNISAKQ